MFLPYAFERAATVVGHERLLFSTDFPCQYRPGRAEADKAAFAHGNWLRLTPKAVA